MWYCAIKQNARRSTFWPHGLSVLEISYESPRPDIKTICQSLGPDSNAMYMNIIQNARNFIFIEILFSNLSCASPRPQFNTTLLYRMAAIMWYCAIKHNARHSHLWLHRPLICESYVSEPWAWVKYELSFTMAKSMLYCGIKRNVRHFCFTSWTFHFRISGVGALSLIYKRFIRALGLISSWCTWV